MFIVRDDGLVLLVVLVGHDANIHLSVQKIACVVGSSVVSIGLNWVFLNMHACISRILQKRGRGRS